ncbi:hypothetical protein AB5J62_29145 [Amycolatopsis sp. cg5]|uniref:hypothetical protein n=1 Tax=Amycolatopsis sp. cg5 TaxID=3238802 RepID=UPI003523E8E7
MTTLFYARPRPGVVREVERYTHLFEIPPEDTPVPDRLIPLCGVFEFGHGQLELLAILEGVPCFACLQKSPDSVPQIEGGQ